jgi:hypothetical protein
MALLKTNTGIGTTNPTSALHVIGDVLITGVITATTFDGTISGTITNAGYASTAGISTVSQGLTGTPNITVGIVTTTNSVSIGGSIGIGTESGIYQFELLQEDHKIIMGTVQAGNPVGLGAFISLQNAANEFDFSGFVHLRDDAGVMVTNNRWSYSGEQGTYRFGPVENLVWDIYPSYTGQTFDALYVASGSVFLANVDDRFYISSPEGIVFGGYGNVGIGTTTASSKLTVVGDALVTGVITATTFDGNITGSISNAEYASTAGVATYSSTSGIATFAQGLSGTPNLNVGIATINTLYPVQLRAQSVAEKTTLVAGNTVGLAFTSGGGNVAICTNPTGDITLNVTDVPTGAAFDNHSITFSVIIAQTGTARSCTAVNLNGVSRTIHWTNGSLANAISGVSTNRGFDIYNFTGINTVGSASTTANYVILGSVNGGFFA